MASASCPTLDPSPDPDPEDPSSDLCPSASTLVAMEAFPETLLPEYEALLAQDFNVDDLTAFCQRIMEEDEENK